MDNQVPLLDEAGAFSDDEEAVLMQSHSINARLTLQNGNDEEVPLARPLTTKQLEEGEEEEEESAKEQRKALCWSMVAMAMSIPALIGACCWPALVIPLVGGTVTAAARTTGHVISFFVTLVMMLCLTGYVAWGSQKRWGTHFQKYGPTYLSCIATVLVMADLTRHLLQDYGVWPEHVAGGVGSAQYKSNCEDSDGNSEVMECLSTVGILFTAVFTYTGFFFLVVASLWNANICDKVEDMREQWKELRGHPTAPQEDIPDY